MMFLKNRHKLMLLAALLMFCVLLSSPVILITASASQSVDPLLIERNWNSADLPEGPIVYNNLEDYVDQLSDLHNESDIGTHSNPATLQVLDGAYDTLTSDNITIPEQTIYDPENGTPLYNQSAYDSWRLDLEVGWTDVDHDEISAELYIYGGTQAEEALRVDIWDNGNWINVISDVAMGWNNVSIASSLVDETLEMRFTGSNTGNTSIQNSWDIDAILLHTWTTVYGSEFTQHGIVQDLGGNLSRYITSVGETNTWNEVNETWHRYLYDPDTKTVQIGNLTITHLPGGALSIDGDAGSRIGRLSWYIQAYYGDQWNNITLDNYQFVGFTKTTDNVTAHQRFWGSQGEMNVYLTYSHFGGFKTRVDIRNDAAQAVPIRAIWAARDVSGLQDNYELLRDENDVLYGIQIEDATFNWHDVLVSDNPLPTHTVVDKPNRRAAVVFGNQSTIIPAGYTATIDPTYTVEHDQYDNYWDDWEGTRNRYDGVTINKLETDGSSKSYQPSYSIALAIPKYATIMSAITEVYIRARSAAVTATVYRLDTANAGVLEGAAWIDTDFSLSSPMQLTGTLRWEDADVGELVQKQINLATWTSGWRIGLRIRVTTVSQNTVEDFSHAETHHSKITVTFVSPAENWLSGYGYRQGHSIDGKTGAGTNYQVKIAVEYGAGTSAGGTIYCNSHCDTDFDDIRFTDNDGQTELDYWMEEKTDSDDATFWVEVTDDLGSDQVIYCYYGKDGVSTTSDGDATFLFFDDFEDNDLDEWVDGADWVVQDSIVQAGTYAAYCAANAAGRSIYTGWVNETRGVMIDTYARTAATSATSAYPNMYQGYDTGDGWSHFYGIVFHSADLAYYQGSYVDWGAPNDAYAANTWYRLKLGIDTATVKWRAWKNDLYLGQIDAKDDGGTAHKEFSRGLATSSTGTNEHLWLDNYFIRYWITTEPANYNWGTEQSPWPTNDATPECTNLDDGNNLYARHKTYNFSVSVIHLAAATDINYVELSCMDGAAVVWTVRYTESDDSFSETAGESYINETLSVFTKAGVDLDIWFGVQIEWTHPDDSNYDLKQYVIDDYGNPDTDTYDTIDYDYETRVDFAPDPTLTDGIGTVDRGNYDAIGSITASATIEYYLSASHCRPPADEVDVWVTCPDTPDPDWHATNYEDSGGTFSVAVDSDDVITGSPNTYTFKVVGNGLGSGGTSHATGTTTATYRADRVIVRGYYFATDTNASLNQDVTITAYLEFEYNNEDVIDGTVTINGVSATHWANYYWNFTDSESTVTLNTYDTVACSGNVHGVTAVNQDGESQQVLWDRINITMTSNLDWTIFDHNVTLTATGEYEYSGDSWSGVITWADRFPSESTVGTYDYGASQITSITDPTYDITVFAAGEEATVIFDDVVPSGAIAYSWMQYSSTKVYLFWGVSSNWMWDYNDTLLNVDVVFHAYSNGSSPEALGGTYGSGAFGGLTLGHYDPTWHYIDLTVNCEFSHAGEDYDWEVWGQVLEVDILHSIQITDSIIYLTDDYVTFGIVTNWNNGSFTIWDNTTKVGYSLEGWHQIEKSSVVGLHNLTILVNGTYGHADGVGQTRDFSQSDSWIWLNFKYTVTEPPSYDCHIVILDSLYELIPFDTFEVYVNDSRIYHDIIQVVDGYGYEITVKNRFGDEVNSTDFSDAHEMIIFVNIYSFKFMSWYNGFLRVNITRSGVTYSQIIMPMEIIEFRLYSENYDFTVDFLNGSTKHYFNIDLVNSTGYIITGDTLADVFSLMNNAYDMINQVNITVTTIQDNTYVIQLMFDWTNTTLYNQSITIIAAFDWTNTTLYNQTISLLNAFNATNTALYDQIILIQNMFSWENTTLFNQTISILNAFNSTNSVLYSQTISILSEISSMNATIYGQTISLLNYLYFNSNSIYNQTIDILTQLSLIDSNITANYISLSASLVAINSTLLSNITAITAQLLLMDSRLLSNFTEISATLLAIDSSLLSNFTYVMANLTAIGTNITTNYLSVAATLSMLDSNLLSNFTEISATLLAIDSSLLSNFTSVTATLAAIGSNVTSNYLSVAAALTLIDSNLFSNFTSITSTLTAMGSNITTNYLAITAELALIDSSLAANFTTMMTKLIATNSSLFIQTLAIISDLEFLNATMYLIDDPTHLNPLVLGYSLSDDYCDLTIVTNWHNASISVYDNDALRTGPTSELLCPIRYPLLATSGTHNLSVYVDGGNDSFWYNISYTVAEIIAFELEDWDVIPLFGVESYLILSFDTTWGNSTTYVYLNGSLQTSIPEQAGGVSSVLWMSGISGLHNYVFNVTSGTNVITITWDFYLPDWAETALAVRWDLVTFQNNYTLITLESNWMNCTYYVYLNSSLVATSYNDPVTLNFTRDMNEGTYNLTIYADGGTQTYTVSNIRYIVTEEGVYYDFSSITGGVTYVEGDTYEGDVTIYENPEGWFMDKTTAAIISVGGVLIIFVAFLVARELKQRDRENREAQYSQ